MLRRIHVTFTLRRVGETKIDAARRAHQFFKEHCPVYRSIHRSIEVTTELRIGDQA